MSHDWTFDEVYELSRAYQPAMALTAAAELDLFGVISKEPLTAEEVAGRIKADLRGVSILLDALAALLLVNKKEKRYELPPALRSLLGQRGSGSILAMLHHQANCQRQWSQLARMVRSGRPTEKPPSMLGVVADEDAFIEAMDNISSRMAGRLIDHIKPEPFEHFLDLGGASGTWTIAFLGRVAGARATLFDLPHVVALADRRLADAGLRSRVELVAGDYLLDPLPAGADLAWVSAIVHQHSRAQNRKLFASLSKALAPQGKVLIRDVLMDESRTSPSRGALFAVHMLVATEGGTTYTFDELREDLEASGFKDARVLWRDQGMNSILQAVVN